MAHAIDEGESIKAAQGTVILREGESATTAYWILAGHVEVYKEVGGRRVVLARLGPGQFFGEMNLVLDGVRSASVAALEDCVLRVITQEGFNHLLREDPESLFPMLRVFFERLRVMNSKYAMAVDELEARQAASGGARAGRMPAPLMTSGGLAVERDTGSNAESRDDIQRSGAWLLKAETEVAKLATDGSELEIKKFPFRIGRKVDGGAGGVLNFNDLYVRDRQPFQVSRNHCLIDLDPTNGFIVLDRGSTLGTVVNGQTLGTQLGRMGTLLDQKANSLILGHSNSPFRFSLIFRPKD